MKVGAVAFLRHVGWCKLAWAASYGGDILLSTTTSMWRALLLSAKDLFQIVIFMLDPYGLARWSVIVRSYWRQSHLKLGVGVVQKTRRPLVRCFHGTRLRGHPPSTHHEGKENTPVYCTVRVPSGLSMYFSFFEAGFSALIWLPRSFWFSSQLVSDGVVRFCNPSTLKCYRACYSLRFLVSCQRRMSRLLFPSAFKWAKTLPKRSNTSKFCYYHHRPDTAFRAVHASINSLGLKNYARYIPFHGKKIDNREMGMCSCFVW